MDWRKVRVLGPRLLVKLDEEEDHFEGSILHKPETVYERAEGWGTVLKVGTGDRIKKGPRQGEFDPIADIKEGDKVCFIKFHGLAAEGPKVQEMLGEGIFFIKVQDVMYVREEDEEGED